jgi:hypothetical protein
MAQLTGGSFKRISPEDIKVKKSTLNQLVDVIQEDVSGSVTRRKYQVFVTGGIGPGITSSLFQTVYDQDFSLQTANPIFDMTVGLFSSGSTVTNSSTGTDSAGKLLFPSQSLMMREKVDIYKQYAANLVGDADTSFYAPFGSTTLTDRIDEALFVSYKRLFSRDKIKRETYATRIYRSGALDGLDGASFPNSMTSSNVSVTSTSGSAIFSDIGAASSVRTTFGGEVGNIVNASNTSETVGLIFYDHGTVVFDMSKTFFTDQHISGTINAMATADEVATGYTVIGATAGNVAAKFIPDLMVSASIDNIIDHIATTRFQSGSLTSATFQNITNINSTLIFCRATADEFNYSTNPTFTDANGRIRVVDSGQEDTQRTFSFITTVGLHDEFGNLLAVAKLSRPIEKQDERDLTLRLRLDF